jgi:epoxyqueuosine reductase
MGFDACGIAKAEDLENEKQTFQKWLGNQYHAEMKWLENNLENRFSPSLLVQNAKSIIVVLKNYFTDNYPFKNSSYKISRYALGNDYHSVLKKQLSTLLKEIQQRFPEIDGRCFVDSAPVYEKTWAHRAGLGWIGKNSLLINRHFGSWTFIGEIFVSTELAYDEPLKNYCGSCRKCIDSCPTGAIVDCGVIDANRCIAYHTIENKGTIPENIKKKLNGWIFGCDICQEVCIWNKRAIAHNENEFLPGKELLSLTDDQFSTLTEEKFNDIFSHSAVKRTKYQGFMRNIKDNEASIIEAKNRT